MKKFILVLVFTFIFLQNFAQNCGSVAINQNQTLTTTRFTNLTFGFKITISQAAPLVSLNAIIQKDVTKAQMGLYTNLNNKPHSRVAVTNSIQNTVITKVENFIPTENIIIQPGDYWIMLELIGESKMDYVRLSYPINNYLEFNNGGISLFSTPTNFNFDPYYQTNNIYIPLGLTLDCTASALNFNENTFVIFPNPARENLYVKGMENKLSYQIYNIQGGIVQNGETTSQKAIPISRLSTGIYFIKLDEQIIKFLKH